MATAHFVTTPQVCCVICLPRHSLVLRTATYVTITTPVHDGDNRLSEEDFPLVSLAQQQQPARLLSLSQTLKLLSILEI